MSKHTPGPWIAGTEQQIGKGETGIVINARKAGYVAHIVTDEIYTGANAATNARLIAAAPRMLELLTLCMDDDDTRQGPLGDEYRAILRDVEG